MEIDSSFNQLLARWNTEQLSRLNTAARNVLAQLEAGQDEDFDAWLSDLVVAVVREQKVRRMAALSASKDVGPAPAASTSTTTKAAAPTVALSESADSINSPALIPAPASPRAPASTLPGPIAPATGQDMDVDEAEGVYPSHIPAAYKDTPPAELAAKRKQALAELRAHIKDLEDHGVPEGEKIIEIDGVARLLAGLYASRLGVNNPEGREALDAMISALETGIEAGRRRK